MIFNEIPSRAYKDLSPYIRRDHVVYMTHGMLLEMGSSDQCFDRWDWAWCVYPMKISTEISYVGRNWFVSTERPLGYFISVGEVWGERNQ